MTSIALRFIKDFIGSSLCLPFSVPSTELTFTCAPLIRQPRRARALVRTQSDALMKFSRDEKLLKLELLLIGLLSSSRADFSFSETFLMPFLHIPTCGT